MWQETTPCDVLENILMLPPVGLTTATSKTTSVTPTVSSTIKARLTLGHSCTQLHHTFQLILLFLGESGMASFKALKKHVCIVIKVALHQERSVLILQVIEGYPQVHTKESKSSWVRCCRPSNLKVVSI